MSLVPRRKRTHSPEFKADLVRQCQQPGISISAVALANQINDNLLRKWINKAAALPLVQSEPVAPAISSQFVPIEIATSSATTQVATPIRIQIQQGKTQIQIEWPMDSAAACAQWLQGWLR
jgi:transposase-like protein